MILKPQQFVQWVEDTRAATQESYMDTVIAGCEKFNIELDLVDALLSEPIRLKIKAEATDRNYFPRTNSSLKEFLDGAITTV